MKNRLMMPLATILSISLSWLVATIFIDFIAVPAVFRTVSKLYEAGSLGIKIFGRFNYFEIIFSIIIIITSALYFRKKKLILVLSFLTIILPLAYTTKITPSIKYYNEQKAEFIDDEKKMVGIQKNLDFYHKLYVRLDSVKLLLLLSLVVTSTRGILKSENEE